MVTGVVQNGDTLTVTTTSGTLEDLFPTWNFLYQQELDNTEKSAYTKAKALAQSMVGTKGVIHPVKVIDNNENSAAKLKSTNATNESLPTVNFYYDFSGLELWSEGGAGISVTEGYLDLGART